MHPIDTGAKAGRNRSPNAGFFLRLARALPLRREFFRKVTAPMRNFAGADAQDASGR